MWSSAHATSPGRGAPAAAPPAAQPGPQPGLRPRPVVPRPRSVQWEAHLSRPGGAGPARAAAPPRRVAGDPGPDLCRGLERRRNAGAVCLAARRPVARACLAVRRRLRPHVLALWKLRNSIAAADYDYRAHDSVDPAAALLAAAALPPHHGADRTVRARCSTSDAGRATSSARCRRAASRSTSSQQAAVRAAVRTPLVHASGFALPVCRRERSPACSARRSSSTCRWSRR